MYANAYMIYVHICICKCIYTYTIVYTCVDAGTYIYHMYADAYTQTSIYFCLRGETQLTLTHSSMAKQHIRTCTILSAPHPYGSRTCVMSTHRAFVPPNCDVSAWILSKVHDITQTRYTTSSYCSFQN